MRFLLVLAIAAVPTLHPHAACASDTAWDALRDGGTVAVVRHARAPGVGDPPGFRLDDCSTQRNLSEEGREQARRIGSAFRERGIPVGRVLSSRWCRSLETARLAFGARTEPFPPLDSFFGNRGNEGRQTQAVRGVVEAWSAREGVLVMVTHQVNITALTEVFPGEGEIVVLRPKPGSGFEIVGRAKP
jgi:broad specificity phosphatase PhoE